MKNALMLAILTIALCGCADSHKEEEHEHAHLHNFTAYTAGHEFFMQHEGIAVNSTACVTLYVSRLSDFKPTAASVATATLKVGDGVQNFTASASEPGIFNFKITPAAAGEGELTFEVDGEKAHFHIDVPAEGEAHDHSHGHAHGGDGHAGHEGHSHAAGEHAHAHGEHSHEGHGHDAGACGHGHNHDGHSHDNHNHAGHDHAAHAGHGAQTEGKPGDIAFGKEQSWKIDFATAVVAETHFGGAVKVAAKVVPAADNFTTIVASTNGKVQFVGNVVEGKDVEEGEALFYLEGGDVTDNDAAVKFAEAESNYLVAKADYERKKTLWNEKVVSERDYQAAEAAYRQAEARYASMKRSFTGSKVTLKALRGGYVATLHVANGDYVEPGTPLATIHSGGVANIVAELPMRYAAQLSTIKDVNIELPSGSAFSMNGHGGSVVAVGKSANACNMLPLTVSAGDIKGLVPGSIVTLYIISESGEPVVTVPRTALVEEMGNLFVFVQNNPVSFEKREVVAGAGDGINVQILKGLHAGERVVTKGAVSLKLSQGADAVDPHAGHVH
jgi:RND family efflux transporter MFP subunit